MDITTQHFHIALSFPGEHRAFVEKLAERLAVAVPRESIFYDQWYEAELAVPNLDLVLQKIYRHQAELVVVFLCQEYESKEWCKLEWRAVRDVLKQCDPHSIMPVRFDDTEIPGLLSIDGYLDVKGRSPEAIADLILKRLPHETKSPLAPLLQRGEEATQPNLYSNRLPSTTGEFFGREAELKLLTDSLADNQTAIVQFIAVGGTGKTKLLQHWLDGQSKFPSLIAWSFYSQGSDEDKQVSATPFFEHLFDLFEIKAEQRQFRSEDEKGETLAGLLLRQPVVLVLDGLEPLQHGGFGMKGELKDRALRVLLKNLARPARPASLCVITSRLTVADLADRATVKTHDLHNLELADGVALLQSLHVVGPPAELEQAVRDYGHHALALSLLGHAVNYWLEGDVRRRDTITELLDGDDTQSRHAFKVMQAYATWLGPAELTLLQMLGLFDHPIEKPVLRLLREQQIPGLTKGMTERDLIQALQSLKQDHHLLFAPSGQPDTVDCHPLLREYFGQRLRQNPAVWQAAQQRLYEYYKALPKKHQPDTLAEMQPLFAAISHGCAAGLHQQALDEVYWPRVLREPEFYLIKELGAFSDDLATMAHFFSQPWQEPAVGLTEHNKASVLNWVGFDLCALGRFAEATQPMRASLEMRVQQENWKEAAKGAGNFSELSVDLGDLARACEYGRQAVNYADQSGDLFQRIARRTSFAEALWHSGVLQEALDLFQAAEQLQQERQPKFPRLRSVQGFRYCAYLLMQGEAETVLERAEWTLALVKQEKLGLLSTALDQLSLAQAHSQLALQAQANAFDAESDHARQAREDFNSAVDGLRAAGMQNNLPLALLARAAWFRATQDYALAHKDLDEAKELAESGPMRLHLCDYHLESARLALAENRLADAREHRRYAAQLIESTGYNRRLPELQALPQ